jgi:hypothetical protein
MLFFFARILDIAYWLSRFLWFIRSPAEDDAPELLD